MSDIWYESMTNEEIHQVIDRVIGTCLGYLVEIGFVDRDLVNGTWYSRFDMNACLENLQFLAAASIDDIGRPVVIFNIEHPITTIAWGMAHEAVHLAQLCKGDWEPFIGYSVWKGQKYINLKADHENYFSPRHQPWEAEAKQYEELVRVAMYEKIPALKDS